MARRYASGRSRSARNARFNRIAPILRVPILDLGASGKQTEKMAHIYLTFDFGKDEEKAQQARHKLDAWKQAFRLDKKMQGKFDRKEDGVTKAEAAPAPAKEKPAKAPAAKGAKGKAKAEAKA